MEKLTVKQELLSLGMKESDFASHAIDLYVRKNDISSKWVETYGFKSSVTTFIDNIEHVLFYEIPFSFIKDVDYILKSKANGYAEDEYIEDICFNVKQLKTYKTIAQGHTENLKIKGEDSKGKFKVWLSRMTIEDGMPYNNEVTIERCNEETQWNWQTVKSYEAK